jgi:hypothetical protein
MLGSLATLRDPNAEINALGPLSVMTKAETYSLHSDEFERARRQGVYGLHLRVPRRGRRSEVREGGQGGMSKCGVLAAPRQISPHRG